MSEYWIYKFASILSKVFPERFAYWFGLRIADWYYRHNHQGRAAIISNLKIIFEAKGIIPAEEALNGFARKTFQYFGKYLIDFFRYASVSPEDIRQRVSFQHREYLDQAIAMNRGAIFLTAHYGNWELGGAVLAALGYEMHAVVLPERLQKLNKMFQRQRKKRGLKLVPVGHSGTRDIIRLLKARKVVAMLGDRDFTGRDDRVEFFGRPARIPRGPAWLSKKLNVPIVPAFLSREVDDTFLLRCYPPIISKETDTIDDLRNKICRVMEKEIGERPYQWFIFDDFWAGEQDAIKARETQHDGEE